MIRDLEIQRLTKYAESLGVPVKWAPHVRGEFYAGLVLDADTNTPMYIHMCTWPGQSKTKIILNLLHEIAHHLSWIYKGRQDGKDLQRVLHKEAHGQELTKEDRRIIYEMEKQDSEFRLTIYRELDIKIPEWKLKLDTMLDVWVYKYWWRTGNYPTQKQIDKKHDEFEGRIRASKD